MALRRDKRQTPTPFIMFPNPLILTRDEPGAGSTELPLNRHITGPSATIYLRGFTDSSHALDQHRDS